MAVLHNFSLPIIFSSPKINSFHLRPIVKIQNRRRSFVRYVSLLMSVLFLLSNFGDGIRSVFTGGDRNPAVQASVPVRVSYELMQAGHRYLDVRTVDEFNAGHVVGATNIPYMLKFDSGMAKNPKFLEEVTKIFGKDDEILIGCQSGKRSLMAASDLSLAGFTGLTNVAGGYASWVQNNLPIEQ